MPSPRLESIYATAGPEATFTKDAHWQEVLEFAREALAPYRETE